MKWISRVPATLREAQAVFAHAAPKTMVPLLEGSHSQTLTSTYGGVEQRWLLVRSAQPRQGYTARGCRFLQAPQFLAAARYRKKPQRIMALLMGMTVCLLVYAA